jgi:hypothetical protein
VTGPTQREAVMQHMSALQLHLSCITDSVVRRVVDGSAKQTVTGDIALAGGLPVRIGRRASLAIVVKQNYQLTEHLSRPRDHGWNLQRGTYIYRLLDADHQELISRHWHPSERMRSLKRTALPESTAWTG